VPGPDQGRAERDAGPSGTDDADGQAGGVGRGWAGRGAGRAVTSGLGAGRKIRVHLVPVLDGYRTVVLR
jgi:hypothetical protein